MKRMLALLLTLTLALGLLAGRNVLGRGDCHEAHKEP
jgi:hypothetical protein